ncbi:MAG: hypothetical protein IRZ06_12850 [Nevskia sp.]|nr:hypothetical protein [Nevskia sp.]
MNNTAGRWVAVASLVAALGAGSAQAAEAPDLLDTLHANRVLSDAQYEALKQQRTATPHWPGIDGYIQFDAPLAVGNDTRLGSRTNLRRFYVHVHDGIAPGWSYTTTFGYFDGKPYFTDGSVTYAGFGGLAVTGGYFKEPFSLSYLTSPKDLLFPERPLPVMALVPGKKIGLQLATHGARWSLAAGVFGGAYDQTADAAPGVAGRWGESLRATITPWLRPAGLWEVGASYAWREADSDHKLSFGYLPESFTVGTKLANTPTITGVSWFSTAGVETRLQVGAFSLQSEYLMAHVERDGAPALSLPGWYAEASWSLTGESRRYDPTTGTVGGLTPRRTLSAGGAGAWELAARYSALDLNSGGVSGGFERNASAGVNWYPEKPLKFMLDAIRVLPVRGGIDAGVASTIVMLRLQAAY